MSLSYKESLENPIKSEFYFYPEQNVPREDFACNEERLQKRNRHIPAMSPDLDQEELFHRRLAFLNDALLLATDHAEILEIKTSIELIIATDLASEDE